MKLLEKIEALAMGLVLLMNNEQRRELAIGLRRIAEQVEACTTGPSVAKARADVIDVEGNA